MLALQIGAAAAGLMAVPHCVVMCGALVAGVSSNGQSTIAGWGVRSVLMGGRILSYTIVGALLGLFSQSTMAFLQASQWLKPLWILLQSGVMVLGFWVLFTGYLPYQLRSTIQRAMRPLNGARHTSAALVAGLGWGLIPCGVLQSVYLMAMMAGDPVQGALTMLAFAIVSTMSLWAGAWFWSRIPTSSGNQNESSTLNGLMAWAKRGSAERAMYRTTGALMGVLAAWGLYHSVLSLLAPGGTAPGVQCA